MVATVDFSSRKADNLVWRTEASLTVVTARKRYQLPEAAVGDSIIVTVNGQVLDRDSDNGFTVISGSEFELKELWPVGEGFILQVGYLRA